MKLLLDSARCRGYGLCQEQAPTLIEFDEGGYANVVVAVVSPEEEKNARACVAACPNSALRLVQ